MEGFWLYDIYMYIDDFIEWWAHDLLANVICMYLIFPLLVKFCLLPSSHWFDVDNWCWFLWLAFFFFHFYLDKIGFLEWLLNSKYLCIILPCIFYLWFTVIPWISPYSQANVDEFSTWTQCLHAQQIMTLNKKN